jgi:hypothetical protein
MKNSRIGCCIENRGITIAESGLVPDGRSVKDRAPDATTVGVIHPSIILLNAPWSPLTEPIMSKPPTPPLGPTVSS